MTGGEAFYADMGHFGPFPIRIAWFGVALPALTLNYFGQGGLLLTEPGAIDGPFYQLAPVWSHYPLVVLATAHRELSLLTLALGLLLAAGILAARLPFAGAIVRGAVVETSCWS